MDRERDFFESTEGSRSENDLALVHILADMLLSALIWEQQKGCPEDALSSSLSSSTHSPLKKDAASVDTEDKE